MNISKIEKTAFWRLLKVLYVGLYLIIFLAISVIAYQNRPQQYASSSKVLIACESGKKYTYEPSIYFDWDTKGKFTDSEMDYTKKVCKYGLGAENINALASAPDQKFTVGQHLESMGSWESVIKTFAIGFVIMFFVIELTKTALLYIIGVNIWQGGLLYLVKAVSSTFNN